MNKEKIFWETKGAEMYLKGTYNNNEISDYEFSIIDSLELEKKNVLEIGPGSGRDIKRFKRRGYSLNALDISGPFIENLNKNYQGDFRVGDMREDLKDFNDISLIYSRWSLLFLTYSEFKNFLKDALIIMSEGGKILVSLREGNSLHNTHKTTKAQSLQMNVQNLVEALPDGFRIDFVQVTKYESTQEKNDRQITFVLTKNTLKDTRSVYL